MIFEQMANLGNPSLLAPGTETVPRRYNDIINSLIDPCGPACHVTRTDVDV